MAYCDRTYCDHQDGACEKDIMPLCAECEDETAVGYFDRGSDYAFWTGEPREIPVCADCKQHLENREPPEQSYDDALATSAAVLNDPTHPRNVEMRNLKR